jgi:hypothetical protein
VHPLVLQAVEEALRGRVVPAVALAAHRAGHPVLGELAAEGLLQELGGLGIRRLRRFVRWLLF